MIPKIEKIDLPKVQHLVPHGMQVSTTEPNWASACLVVTSHAMRALAYLETERPDLAQKALRDLRLFTEDPVFRIKLDGNR